MITVHVQIHGYRKGHQLLASSIILPKGDQTVVDRLSDVAGPLRPKEQFKPYLAAYPLPSGNYYVVARTWQDLTVPRAGCVLTKSVLIDARLWSVNAPLLPLLELLDPNILPDETQAREMELPVQGDIRLPAATNFSGSELLEALFLEDAKPVVVFDAPDPELIALRLLTSLWPDIRRRFSLSTFALSPRKIGGRDLDLVFAPSNAKAKFSDWSGRRVDGRLPQNDRHRWTGAIVRRVFEDELPRLLSDRELSLLGDRGETAAALRIALLWEELSDKLYRTPGAALGLLDIANSGMVSNSLALQALEPRLAEAIRHAPSTMSPQDAWDFAGALVRKMHGYKMPLAKHALAALVEHLSQSDPVGAINLLRQPDPKQTIESLAPSIATGMGKASPTQIIHALTDAPLAIFASLVAQGDGPLTAQVAADDGLIGKVSDIFREVEHSLATRAGAMLLPYLIDDRQLPAAIPIFSMLDAQAIATALRRLGESNGYEATRIGTALVLRAREVEGLLLVRDVLLQSQESGLRDTLLAISLEPVAQDMLWLLEEKRLSKAARSAVLLATLERADDQQFTALLRDSFVGERMVQILPDDAIELLTRALMLEGLSVEAYAGIVRVVIPKVSNAQRFTIAKRAIERLLQSRFEDDEVATLYMLFDVLGARFDGVWVANLALDYHVPADVASRNMLIFESAPAALRQHMVEAVTEIAFLLQQREHIDLTAAAYNACAGLFMDAEKQHKSVVIEAAGRLVPSLLRARHKPVSPLIAALFPVVYRELAKADDVPELLKFITFMDWDRCKAARHELVDAFTSSAWPPGDLALTAYRCRDVSRILKRVTKSHDGSRYLVKIGEDLGRLEGEGRRVVRGVIAEIMPGLSNGLEG
ncbi:GAP1-N1 domain-containing protein [Stutzerimonas chloritidismutans]